MIIVITGTSSGLGYNLALHFSQSYFVYGIARSSSKINNSNYHHLKGSVNDESFIQDCLNKIIQEKGKIDLLINNAGVASMNHMLTTPIESVKAIFDTNFTGTFLCTREFSKALIKSKSPRIINISSIATEINIEGELAYSSSKAALNKLTKLAAIELEPLNITVNAISLPPFASKLTNGVEDEKLRKISERTICRLEVNIDSIINVIEFISNPRSNQITGETINIGGVK